MKLFILILLASPSFVSNPENQKVLVLKSLDEVVATIKAPPPGYMCEGARVFKGDEMRVSIDYKDQTVTQKVIASVSIKP